MKRKTRKALALLLAFCMTLSLLPMLSVSTSASYVQVTIADSMAADAIEREIQSAIDTVSSGNTVIVTGIKTNEVAEISLNIPAGVTVVWCASSEDLSFTIDGGGTFEVTTGGKIDVSGVAIHVENGNVVVSGGEVSAYGDFCTAIEVIKGNITVSDGTVSANMDFGHGCYAICLGYVWTSGTSNTVKITGGNVSANSFYGPSYAISLQNGGLAAFLAGTCDGEFEVFGRGVIVEVESLALSPSIGGTTTGLTHVSGNAMTDVKWDTSGAIPAISLNNGQYSIEWAEPGTTPPTPPTPPAANPVRIRETGELFGTLSEAIAAADIRGLDVFTIEVIGDVTETSSIRILSNITIVGAEGAHTVTMSDVMLVENGGCLTLGDGGTANALTISGSVSVKAGSIYVKDGVILKSKGTQALLLSGPEADGAISGGRLEGSITALSIEKGAQLSEISGGVFTGKQDAVHLSDAGTMLGKISGGAFYQTDADITLHGHAVFVQNYSQIGEISGGYFEAISNSALVLIRGGKVGEISGGEFVANRYGVFGPPDTRNAAVWIENGWESEGFEGTGIGTISGGHFKGTNFGVLSIADYSYTYINYITGGTFEGRVALQNDRGSSITEISGGQFTGNQGILNAGEIGKVGGTADILGKTSYAVFNYTGGQIDEIYGGMIVSNVSSGIANAGTIKLISGGTMIGLFSAISCDGLNKGKLETISNGVFWGKYDSAISLAYELRLEPGLNDVIGAGRYWGSNGKVFNNESLVVYPDGYLMSEKTLPVPGITEVEFKYLTNGSQPVLVNLSAKKAVSGEGASLKDGQFSFAVYDGAAVAATGVNDANGHIVFSAIAYTQLGTHKYVIKETSRGGSGWTTDSREYGVTVVITDENDMRNSEVIYEGGAVPTFINQYKGSNPGGGDPGGGDPGGGNPGGGNPGGNPPTLEIPEEKIPLLPFVSEHVAYIIGYPDGRVGPSFNITRAETATIFFRLLTDETRETYWTQENPFKDVRRQLWYNNAISVMSRMGIINGYPDGAFKPGNAITRAEFAVIVARCARMMQMTSENEVEFSDIVGHWAQSDIDYATSIGWLNGYPDGTFRPDRPITRAETMTLVNRIMGRIPETKEDLLSDLMILWLDNSDPDIWYYLAVQEATNSHKPDFKSKPVPGLHFMYEHWTAMIPNRDWSQLEKDWAGVLSD